jgi:hypothetical protein
VYRKDLTFLLATQWLSGFLLSWHLLPEVTIKQTSGINELLLESCDCAIHEAVGDLGVGPGWVRDPWRQEEAGQATTEHLHPQTPHWAACLRTRPGLSCCQGVRKGIHWATLKTSGRGTASPAPTGQSLSPCSSLVIVSTFDILDSLPTFRTFSPFVFRSLGVSPRSDRSYV